MEEPRHEQDDVVVLPPVPVDPVFAEAVEEALAGEQPPTSAHDPYRIVGADPHDFAGLYIRHRSSFSLHARRFLRDPRDVDEVVQEAFLRLFLALPELETELQALAYCRRTITNLCIDRYRADQRRPRLVDLESVPPDALPDDELDDPVVQAEDAAVVRAALALLSPLHRDALVKREIEEKPLPVIALELDVPEESVKHLLHRARRALRRRLTESYLAGGADLDATSTLSLLVRSAAQSGGKACVVALLFAGVALGASGQAPAEALVSLWQGVLPTAPADLDEARERVAAGDAAEPAAPEGVFTSADRDHPGPVVAPVLPLGAPRAAAGAGAVAVPAAVLAVGPAAAVTGTVDTEPRATPSVTTGPSPDRPTEAPAAAPGQPDPTPEPPPSPRPSPSSAAPSAPAPDVPTATPSPRPDVAVTARPDGQPLRTGTGTG